MKPVGNINMFLSKLDIYIIRINLFVSDIDCACVCVCVRTHVSICVVDKKIGPWFIAPRETDRTRPNSYQQITHTCTCALGIHTYVGTMPYLVKNCELSSTAQRSSACVEYIPCPQTEVLTLLVHQRVCELGAG